MGKDRAFAEYVAAHWASLYRLATLFVGESGADDVTQAALLKAYTSWHRVERAESPEAYIRRILVNTALSEGRGRSRRLRLVPDEGIDRPHGSHESAVVERSAMWDRINGLPPRQRAVIVLRYYEDLSEAEIARTLGCAPGTVKAHASAALRTLRLQAPDAELHETTGGHHD